MNASDDVSPISYLKCKTIRAFTLVEVLVASAVVIVLSGMVLHIAGLALNTYSRSVGNLSANAEARLALDMVAQDLETAVLRNNGQQWLRVEGPTSINPGAPYDTGSVVLKLFAPTLDGNGDGICAIVYKLEYRESYAGGPKIYALYRRVVDPQTTFSSYLGSSFDHPADSPQGNLEASNTQADWSMNTITQNGNFLASNIVEFKVIVYDRTSVPKSVNANPETNAIIRDYAFGGAANLSTSSEFDGVSPLPPLYAEIILTVVTDQGMDLLNNIAQGRASENTLINAANVVNQHGKTLIRRIYFKVDPI